MSDEKDEGYGRRKGSAERQGQMDTVVITIIPSERSS